MNQELFYIIIIIAIGYLLKRMNLLKEKDGETISRIIFNITLPALIIVSLHSVKIESSLTMLPVIVLLFGIFSIILSFWVFRKEEKELKGTFIMIASGYNVGLFVFPFVEAIWGAEGLLYFGMFDVGNSMITFGIAYLIASYFSEEGLSIKPGAILKKFSKSIPLMSYVIMSILNFSHIHLPSEVIDVATTISKANMPLSLLLLGLYLNFSFEKQYIRPIISVNHFCNNDVRKVILEVGSIVYNRKRVAWLHLLLFLILTLLYFIVDFYRKEGGKPVDSSKMLSHFLRAWANSRM